MCLIDISIRFVEKNLVRYIDRRKFLRELKGLAGFIIGGGNLGNIRLYL